MNDIQMHQKELETKLWAMANNLRGTMEAYEFKNYILGMIFYYYLSKREEDYIFDLSDEELAGLMVFAKRVAAAIKAAIPCVKVGITVLGLEVPHAHVHLVPMQKETDMNFFRQKLTLPAEEMQEICNKITEQFK